MSDSDTPDPKQVEDLETLQRHGLAALVRAAPEEVAKELGIRCFERGSAIYVGCKRVPGVTFNRIQGFGIDGETGREQIAVAERWAQENASGAQLLLPPLQDSLSLIERLQSQGFQPTQRSTVFTLPATRDLQIPPTNLVRVETASESQAELFGSVSAEGLGKPSKVGKWLEALIGQQGVTAYIAWAGKEPLGAAALFVEGEFGWLFLASTRPRCRDRGAQTALLRRRVADAREAGVKTFSVEVLTPRFLGERGFSSYRNCKRLGFEVAYERSHFELR